MLVAQNDYCPNMVSFSPKNVFCVYSLFWHPYFEHGAVLTSGTSDAGLCWVVRGRPTERGCCCHPKPSQVWSLYNRRYIHELSISSVCVCVWSSDFCMRLSSNIISDTIMRMTLYVRWCTSTRTMQLIQFYAIIQNWIICAYFYIYLGIVLSRVCDAKYLSTTTFQITDNCTTGHQLLIWHRPSATSFGRSRWGCSDSDGESKSGSKAAFHVVPPVEVFFF